MPTSTGRAVVIGAGIAGLSAARVLSDHFEEVVLLERDVLPDAIRHRKGVPQGQHFHTLLPGGLRALERLFPGYADDVVALGGRRVDLCADPVVVGRSGPFARSRSDLVTLAASRALLETVLRGRVRALANVRVVDGCDVLGLRFEGDAVTGVRYLLRAPDSAAETVDADLVIDAAGRASRTPAWLEERGLPTPEVEQLAIGVTYLSNRFRADRAALGGGAGVIVLPANRRAHGAASGFLEDGTFHVTLAAYFGDSHDHDMDGYAARLGNPKLLAIVDRAEPVGAVATARTPAEVRRHYERLARHPRGLLTIGDAVAAFNPAYAQGMTVAALEAEALATLLPGPIDPRRYYRRMSRIIAVPWDVALTNDSYVEGVGGRTPRRVVVNAFLDRVHAAACVDADVARGFAEVIGMVASRRRMFRPAYLLRVWRGSRRATHRPGPPAAAPTATHPSTEGVLR